MSLIKDKAVVDIRTVHYAMIQWWWKDSHVHDYEYKVKVNDAMDMTIAFLEEMLDVTNDTRFCCQWEGLQLYSESMEDIQKAAKKLSEKLSQFKFVEFIGMD